MLQGPKLPLVRQTMLRSQMLNLNSTSLTMEGPGRLELVSKYERRQEQQLDLVPRVRRRIDGSLVHAPMCPGLAPPAEFAFACSRFDVHNSCSPPFEDVHLPGYIVAATTAAAATCLSPSPPNVLDFFVCRGATHGSSRYMLNTSPMCEDPSTPDPTVGHVFFCRRGNS